jgi:hypothetical protein
MPQKYAIDNVSASFSGICFHSDVKHFATLMLFTKNHMPKAVTRILQMYAPYQYFTHTGINEKY